MAHPILNIAINAAHIAGAIGVATETFDQDVGEFGRQCLAGSEVSESVERRVGELFQSRLAGLQLADRQYWRGIIGQLKALRTAGMLMREGEVVATVI